MRLQGGAEYAIPAAKLEKYSLNMEKQPDKARAFRDYLGYVQDDAATVAAKLYEFVSEKEPEPRPPDKWGDRFSTRMVMGGKGGKVAKVKAGWIRESGAAKMRAASVYVDE